MSTPPDTTATVQQSAGCTLAAYAEAKGIPVDVLKQFGLSEIVYMGAPAVRIPYLLEGGETMSTRYRTALDGPDRFRWKSGSKTGLYGWWKRADAVEARYAVLVEGESDTHTGLYHGLPFVGIPGANTWQEQRDAPYFEGLDRIYVVAEPDKGGETVMRWLSQSAIRDRAYVVDLGEHKDPSGLYAATGDRFPDAWQAAMDTARPWSELDRERQAAQTSDAWEQCRELAESPDILQLAAETVEALGLSGERRNVTLLYLAITSRLFERPASVAVKGPSSAGKSHLVDSVLTLFPDDAYYALSAMSERALAYSEEPLRHRILVIYEAAGMTGDFQSYLMRSLLSEGCVKYETVEKTSDGLRARLIEREGPTGLLVTTTAARLHPENETRLLSLWVTDAPDRTRDVFRALASRATLSDGPSVTIDLESWRALQTWLANGEHRVAVPYAVHLAELIPPVAVRLRRDFGLLLTLIRAHAVLHRATRAETDDGAVIATLADYAAVRELTADLFADGVEATVSPATRETVAAVKALLSGRLGSNGIEPSVSIAQLAKHLELDKGSVSRRVRVALDREYLRNLETRRGKPMRLVGGDAMPDELVILPTVEDVADRCSVAVMSEGIPTPSPPPEPEPGPNRALGPLETVTCQHCGTSQVPHMRPECYRCGEPHSATAHVA
jgi:hypothetical protein